MDWALRYTFHAGYEPPAFSPQFAGTVGSDDPVAHVHFAAEQGAAGVLYAWAPDRSEAEVARVGAALAETGLHSSCMLATDSSLIFTPAWTDRTPGGRQRLAAAVERSCRLATTLRGHVLAALVMADAERGDLARQHDDVVANLAEMGALAAGHGHVLALEPMTVLPMMFPSVQTAMEVIRRVGSPDVGLIYDTAHVASGSEALMETLVESFDHIVSFQLADLPGRVEPGGGTLELVAVTAEAVRRGYTGLVDLEHGWLTPGVAGETAGLARLRAFDAALRVQVG